jgi:hypothetical protein
VVCREEFLICLMAVHIPVGLIAIGVSMYVFYSFHRRRRAVLKRRRNDLNEVRQSWLNHQLGVAYSDIILYGDFMEQKIAHLRCLGTDIKMQETYFVDEESGDKWVKEYVEKDDEFRLRKVEAFRFE